ncbi:phasin family protein [Sedimentimonas flavescens]|uniref:Phasin family protein n=1 Tax=Sedimentimonas flavescens TaxID=2851012 RepID=A0ABT2ZYR1_9RHOB|nr:phasin family protein [Sedimentimonas flavescens]MBW0157208.1 phasin family protein [Sedimentimonas flavescens]MCV2878445.1 phasin family protein [Sedimentimonas flavescens]WBL34485.1 phasin family protein [Sinirhodobacter sp. HNIBRBA609]
MASKKQNPFGAMAGCMPTPSVDMSMFLRPQARMAEALLKQNIETLDFLKTRFERDRSMLADLADAKDPNEAMALWTTFWQRMLSDYSTETNKLAASVTEIAEQAVRTATEEGNAIISATGKKD